jgi:hypothetical protein
MPASRSTGRPTVSVPPHAFGGLGGVALSIRHWRRLPSVVAAVAGWLGLVATTDACCRPDVVFVVPGPRPVLLPAPVVLGRSYVWTDRLAVTAGKALWGIVR